MSLKQFGVLVLCVLCMGCQTEGSSDGDTHGSIDTSGQDSSDPCALVANACSSAGTQCDAQTLVICAEDVNGCLVESRTDCASQGAQCGGRPAACQTSVDCTQVAHPCAEVGQACEGSELIICALNAQGCLEETRTECDQGDGNRCDAGADPPACTGGPCEDSCGSLGPGGGDERTCEPDNLGYSSCEYLPAGCFQEVVTQCPNGGSCREPNPGQARCEDPCTDASECSGQAAGTARCAPNAIETCTDWDDDGCIELLVTDCGGGTCDDSSGTPMCSTPAELILGTNDQFAGEETFVALSEGSEIPITRGFQGSFMVIVALKTRGMLTSPVRLSATAEIQGGENASLTLNEQPLYSGDGGYFYLTDFFVAFGFFEPPADGTPITVTCSVEDALGVTQMMTINGTTKAIDF